MDKDELNKITERWNGAEKGYKNLSFEEAKADMEKLLAEIRNAENLKRRINELEATVRKRNSDMQAFATEVNRLATQKYADYSGIGT